MIVELGWIAVGELPTGQTSAVRQAADRVRRRLNEILPEFEWRLSVVTNRSLAGNGTVSATRLLDIAERERDANGWDFVFCLTDRELVTYANPFAVALPSQLLAAAVLSTANLIPDREPGFQGKDLLIERLCVVALQAFGRLNGLPTADAVGKRRVMRSFSSPRELKDMREFSSEELARLVQKLHDVADLRVEEDVGTHEGGLRFYLRSISENRRALPQAVLRMQPWSFPLRLSRLTTAAGSALFVLMLTAEAWELAGSLSGTQISAASVLALVSTSTYLLTAQRLLAGGAASPMREQRAVRNVGTVVAVLLGMGVTWATAFLVAMAAGVLLFGDELLTRWIGAGASPAYAWTRIQMAGFCAALAIIIGALGASFEPYGYFRHVTYVDDEI